MSAHSPSPSPARQPVSSLACCCHCQVAPDDAKLWCALGDIQQNEAHYHKAWEVSGHRSSRAQRSLAKAALNHQDYAAAAAAFEKALALSPLYPDAWFSLGYCYMRNGEDGKALQVQEAERNGSCVASIKWQGLQQHWHSAVGHSSSCFCAFIEDNTLFCKNQRLSRHMCDFYSCTLDLLKTLSCS